MHANIQKNSSCFLLLLFWPGEIEGMVGQDSRHHGSSPDSAVLEMRPCHLTSLNLSFLLCKMGNNCAVIS